jgi:hypothetical protein
MEKSEQKSLSQDDSMELNKSFSAFSARRELSMACQTFLISFWLALSRNPQPEDRKRELKTMLDPISHPTLVLDVQQVIKVEFELGIPRRTVHRFQFIFPQYTLSNLEFKVLQAFGSDVNFDADSIESLRELLKCKYFAQFCVGKESTFVMGRVAPPLEVIFASPETRVYIVSVFLPMLDPKLVRIDDKSI